ncbi:hypothetical protein Tco_1034145 [Tanacetum coccineum]
MSIEIKKKEKELRQREQAANVSTYTPEPSRRFNFIYDDDEESTIPLNEIISQLPLIITILPTMEPEDSLIMGDEDLRTIPEKESDEFIKSSVEDLVPIPRGDIDEIDAFLDIDVSTDIEDGYHDSEGDIIYLESLLFDDTIPHLPPEVFLDHDLKNLKDGPDNEDLKRMNKVFDPGIHE